MTKLCSDKKAYMTIYSNLLFRGGAMGCAASASDAQTLARLHRNPYTPGRQVRTTQSQNLGRQSHTGISEYEARTRFVVFAREPT